MKMIASENAIARYADFSTEEPNELETLRTVMSVRETSSFAEMLRIVLSCTFWVSCLLWIRKPVYPPAVCEPVPTTCGSATPASSMIFWMSAVEWGWGDVNSTRDPPVKSIPSLRPLFTSANAEIATAANDSANHRRHLPIRSYFFQRSPVPMLPRTRGLDMNEKPASRLSIARVATTAVKIDVMTPISSISAKPLTLDVVEM